MPCRILVDGIDPLCPDPRRFTDMEGATNMRRLIHGKVFPLEEIGWDRRLYCFAEEGTNEGFYVYLVIHERASGGLAEGKIHIILSIKTLSNAKTAAKIVHDLTVAIHSVKDPGKVTA